MSTSNTVVKKNSGFNLSSGVSTATKQIIKNQKRRSSRLSISQDKSVPAIQESISESGEKSLKTSIFFARSKREKAIIDVDSPLIRQMESSQYDFKEVLNYVLELTGYTDTGVRLDTLQKLSLRSQDMNNYVYSSSRIDKLNQIIDLCNKQIQHVTTLEVPIEKIQKHIRSWVVRDKISLLGRFNLSLWETFLKTERIYVAQIASILKNYRNPLQRKVESGQLNLPVGFLSLFENSEHILSISNELLNRLETQNNYYPIIFGIGNIFLSFAKELADNFKSYVNDLARRLDIYEELTEQSNELFNALLTDQWSSEFPDYSLEELLRLTCDHVLGYEERLGDLVRGFVRSVNLVVNSECNWQGSSFKPLNKFHWTFMVDFGTRKIQRTERSFRNNRSSLALSGAMKTLKESTTPGKENKPKKKKDILESDDPDASDTDDKSRRTKFPLLRSTTATIEELTGRKRANTALNNKSTTTEPPRNGTLDRKSKPADLESIMEPRNDAVPVAHAETERTGVYRREKSSHSKLVSQPKKHAHTEDKVKEIKPLYDPRKEKDLPKVDPASLPPSVLEELKSLWIGYQEMKQETQKLEKQIGAALFFHLYKKQLKKFEWIRRSHCEILDEGDFVLHKKKLNEKDKEELPLSRHYFLFSTFLVLSIPVGDVKQKSRDTDGKSYYIKTVWDLSRVSILSVPEPVDDDDKISFQVSVVKTFVPKDANDPVTETSIVNIICDDQFYKLLREQLDQTGTNVFGVDLMKLSKRQDTTDGIPNILLITTQWIKTRCTDVEGIFRKSGSLAQVEDLKSRLDQGALMALGDEEDEHVVANIIKLFFREMPVPLIPFTHYPHYMDIGCKLAEHQITSAAVVGALTPHLINLPRPHLKLLIFLLKFLSEMSQYAELTKMDTANLAIVFASNILKPEEESMEMSLKFNHVNNLFKVMIEKVDEIISVLPKDDEAKYDNWLQDAMKNTRSIAIYFEDGLPPVEKEIVPPPSEKPQPPALTKSNSVVETLGSLIMTSPKNVIETRSTRSGSELDKKDSNHRKSGKATIWGSSVSKDKTTNK